MKFFLEEWPYLFCPIDEDVLHVGGCDVAVLRKVACSLRGVGHGVYEG